LGYPAKAEVSASSVSAEDFDGVVIPGGFAPDYIRRSAFMLDFVREMADQGKIVAAICHGPWVLCSTAALRGRRATSFFAIKDDVTNAGADWVDEPVVRDGNIITSRTPDDLPLFLRSIIDAVMEVVPSPAS
jgi:protease I